MTGAPEPGRSSEWPQFGTAVLAVLAIVLAAVGMSTTPSPPALVDVLYRSLQLFVLEGSALDGFEPLNPWLQVARFVAPVATVLAVLVTLRSLLGDRWLRRRIAATVGHAIVCGDSDAAVALARSLRESGRAVVLVGSVSAEAPGGGNVPAVPGDPREPSTLRAAGIGGAQDLYACAARSAVNAAVALVAGQLRDDPSSRLSTYAQVRSDDLVEALRVRRLAAPQPDSVTMDFFALDDIAARLLVGRYPPDDGSAPVVVGFGSLGQAVLRAIVRAPGAAPVARPVVVVSIAANAAIAAQAARLGVADSGWEVRPGVEADGGGPVYICLADEDEAVSTGLRLGRAGDRDVVVCLQRASPFAEALGAASRLKIFGVLDETCRQEAIAGDSIVSRAARAIHEHYRADADARGDSVATNPSMAPWSELPVSLQEANVAQAESIGQKLDAIGAGLTTLAPSVPFAFEDHEIEVLARREHVRWMAERRGRGFVYGTRREGMSHPDLRDWSDLSEESRDKDRDAVRHMPDVLAAEGLYIRRGPGA
jgi:voltage-gated potassium channel Kch